MTGAERGFLLLSSSLGVSDREPLTDREMDLLSRRARELPLTDPDRELTADDLCRLGYSPGMAGRILGLLSDGALLEYYIQKGRRTGSLPLTRIGEGYPPLLRRRLGRQAPGCLWLRGDLRALDWPAISLVGSRDLEGPNLAFAQAVGREAAKQGFTLVSGNARGADRAAQGACLSAGGWVVSVVADRLDRQRLADRLLYLSEDGYDRDFSAQRAIHRNRVIHALGSIVLVAQARLGIGGTWSGTAANLRGKWSPVFFFSDGSPASARLKELGATPVSMETLSDFRQLLQENKQSIDQ